MSLYILLPLPLKSLAVPSNLASPKYGGCPLFFVFSFQPPNPLSRYEISNKL